MKNGKKPPTKSKTTKTENSAAGHFIPFAFIGAALLIGFVLWLLQPPDSLTHTVANQRIENALGFDSDLSIEKRVDQPTKIRLMLRDRKHEPVKGAKAEIIFSGQGKKIKEALVMDEPGVYRAVLDVPKGRWDARVTVQLGSYDFQAVKDVTLP